MKKIMMFLMVAVLMLGFSGQAMAAFESGHLIRVVYSGTGTGMETATDLGLITNITAPTTANYSFSGQGTFDLASIGGTPENSYVAYFAVIPSGSTKAWVGGTDGGQRAVRSNFSNFSGASGTTGYTGMLKVAGAGATQVTTSQLDPKSYWNTLNNGSGSGAGLMRGFISPSTAYPSVAVSSLADLSTVGYVDMKLYYYSAPSGIGTTYGVNVATIRTYADGHTELNPVPVPAAVYLLGSGLLGLVGIRRKMAA